MQTETAHSPARLHAPDDVIVDLKASMVLLLFVALIGAFGAVGLLFSLM